MVTTEAAKAITSSYDPNIFARIVKLGKHIPVVRGEDRHHKTKSESRSKWKQTETNINRHNFYAC